jgi:2-polyprenyl-6-methoxyphenol hydroxylase-like FAD-dependent oxidoreductase
MLTNLKEWYLAHRAHLHSQLKDFATSATGLGKPAQIHTSSKVVTCDPHTGTVVFQDGSEQKGDVIVGADGVHSLTRQALAPEIHAFKSDHNAIRFLITRQQALDNDTTREWAQALGSMDIWYGYDRKIVSYSCANDSLLNFVCIHSAELSESSDGYDKAAPKAKLLEIYRDFDPMALRLLEMADPETIRVWPLFDMETLPSFVNDKLALIGDAAHPFTPHLAQGGAQAIEDAVSLGVMLSRGLDAQDVPARLELYNRARHDRATRIQGYSRMVGGNGKGQRCTTFSSSATHLQKNLLTNPLAPDYGDYALSHDEYYASSHILRKYLWQSQPGLSWLQPTTFGPFPGPRQDLRGHPREVSSTASYVTRTINFKTSATFLRNLFPNSSYRFVKADTVAYASLLVTSQRELPWLEGRGYDSVSLRIHEVQYSARNGEILQGSYLPLVLENLPDSILWAREELGYPALFSDISVISDGDCCNVAVSWNGVKWAEFHWRGLQEHTMSPESSAHSVRVNGEVNFNGQKPLLADNQTLTGTFVHKYIPASDSKHREAGRADVDYDVYFPAAQSNTAPILSTRKAQSAEIKFHPSDSQRLPTLHHIVDWLAEVPVLKIVDASEVQTPGFPDLSDARRLD